MSKPKQRITAGRSILENTATGAVFIATKATEETQCLGPNRDHIQWVGELDVPIPDAAALLRELCAEIEHGDESHRAWLRAAVESFIERKCLD